MVRSIFVGIAQFSLKSVAPSKSNSPARILIILIWLLFLSTQVNQIEGRLQNNIRRITTGLSRHQGLPPAIVVSRHLGKSIEDHEFYFLSTYRYTNIFSDVIEAKGNIWILMSSASY